MQDTGSLVVASGLGYFRAGLMFVKVKVETGGMSKKSCIFVGNYILTIK